MERHQKTPDKKYRIKDNMLFEVRDTGLIYTPQWIGAQRKHDCPDCMVCAQCSDARCETCKEKSAGSERSAP